MLLLEPGHTAADAAGAAAGWDLRVCSKLTWEWGSVCTLPSFGPPREEGSCSCSCSCSTWRSSHAAMGTSCSGGTAWS